MSSNDNSDGVCVVCFKPIEIFSIGDCDHPVCFECSTRMRVLCLQTECPICRHDISKVVFTSKVDSYKNVIARLNNNKKIHYDEKYKILFMDITIKETYQKLLEHFCKKCGGVFKSFNHLKDHMSREHEFFFCDLCIENLKIFTNERKFYSRQQLAVHRSKGDPDDTSHKGHPKCKFCDTRYMDNDELFRHLRKDHLYCHFCDADGFHRYYVSFHTLRDHFRKDHFLCEEGDCCSEGNMTAFRTDIDFRAHKASEHGRGLSKQAARQARTLEVQFTLTPRPMHGSSRTHARQERSEGENVRNEANREPINEVPQAVVSPPVVDMDSIQQFPTLGDFGPNAMTMPMNRHDKPVIRQTTGALARTDENFPALSSDTNPGAFPSTSFRVNISHPGPSSTIIRTSSVKPNVSIQVGSQQQSAAANRQMVSDSKKKHLPQHEENGRNYLEDFPSLHKKDRTLLMNDYTSYSNSNNIRKGQTNQVNVEPIKKIVDVEKLQVPPTLEAFPALQPNSSGSNSITQPQWIAKVKPKEVVKKQVKDPVPIHKPPKPQINNISEFPAPPPASGAPFWLNGKKEKNVKNNSTASSADTLQPQWVTAKPKVPAAKASKVNAAPVIPTQEMSIADFPSLKSKQKKKPSKEVETDVNDNSLKVLKQKDKSKQIQENNTVPKWKPPQKDIDKTSKESKLKMNSSNNNCNKKTTAPQELNNSKQGPEIHKNVNNSTPRLLPDFSPRSSVMNSQDNTPQCNGFTFTSSLGQNYKIPAHNYIQPVNFNDRNKLLVSKFMEVLGETEAIHQFKIYSQLFREGTYTADCYYQHCIESMKDGFKAMFPELLVLLPDIRKQQELYKVHLSASGSPLHICNICGQILVVADMQYHNDFHAMQSAFPALGPPPSVAATKQNK